MNRLDLLDLADFENIYLLNHYDKITYAELMRRHTEKRANASPVCICDRSVGGDDNRGTDYLDDVGVE
jgi:hypothetical protein